MKTKTWVYLIIAASFFVNSQCKKDKNDTLIKAGYNVVDVDGNVYHTLIIGSQVWMVENLKTTKYNDATVIPFISEKSAWSDLQTSGSCYYNNTIFNQILCVFKHILFLFVLTGSTDWHFCYDKNIILQPTT